MGNIHLNVKLLFIIKEILFSFFVAIALQKQVVNIRKIINNFIENIALVLGFVAGRLINYSIN